MGKVKEKLTQVGAWVWEHKKWFIIVGVGAVVVVVGVKKREAIKDLIASLNKSGGATDAAEQVAETTKAVLTPAEVLEHRTGVMLTPTKLGNKVGASAQEINKRIVAAELAERLPCGEYILTKKGKLFAQKGLTVRPWGYTAPLMEYDEAVLELIYTPEELAKIAERKRFIQEIAKKTSA